MINIKGLNIKLKNFQLGDLDLAISENDFFVLMGPTGAGKTLLLEAIAGLIPVNSGKISIGKIDVTSAPPEKRGVGIVYQDHALFPHLTVLENIAYGLHFHKVDKTVGRKRLTDLIDTLKIDHILERLPVHLSGGEKQRVAMARALIVRPKVLLLDEPLSALDTGFREEIRIVLKELHRSSNTTFLMITHDFSEALFLAEHAAIINKGGIEQTGRANDLFQRPVSPFVAEFVGMKNVLPAVFKGRKAVFGECEVDLGKEIPESTKYIAIRPEDVLISSAPLTQNGYRSFKGTIVDLVDNGFYFNVSVRTGSIFFHALLLKSTILNMNLTYGMETYVNLTPSRIHSF